MRPTLITTSIFAVSFLLISEVGFSQISLGGQPRSMDRGLNAPAGIRTPNIDLSELEAQDAINDQDKSIPYRFGYNHVVDYSLANSGTWNTLSDGTRLWRLGIECPGALSVNFEFHDYRPAPGAKIFVLDETGDHIGAFTTANDHGEHVLGVQAVKGSRITIEYQVPPRGELGSLQIGQITHGYRDLFGYARALGSSGACNNNVICPEGDPWRDQIRSVAMITVNGSGICTGTLINNCASDGTPYFLTANHCLPGNLNVSTWVFRFNWDSPSCSQNQNGPTNQTVSGATVLAHSGGSDVGLLRLNSTPPSSYNVYYSGWDKSGSIPTNQTAIHHPAGDLKKISFDNNPATQATYGGAAVWKIGTWEDGTTEPGSSGSGLWDQNHRLIGQLYGGDASCANNVNDNYGRFNVSYPLLETWLGACGNTIDGYDPNVAAYAVDAQLASIIGVAGSSCISARTPFISVRNAGSTTLTSFTVSWSVTNGPSGSIPWTGSLATGATVQLATGSIILPDGIGTFTATVTAPNGGTDQNPANNQSTAAAVYGSISVTLNLTLDRYGEETSWEVRNGTTIIAGGGPFTQGASNGAYPQSPITICVPVGCHDLVIRDSYGDGICCTYGNGSYNLTDAVGAALVSYAPFTSSSTTNFCVTATNQVQLSAKAVLEGPYNSNFGTMNDSLRVAGAIPLQEPYTALGFAQVGGGGETAQAGVFNTTGNNAIVDWVLLELRSGSPAYAIVATRNALLQRDGDVVDVDGISPVQFGIAPGSYRIAIRHRNHMGAMTLNAVALSASTTIVDFRSNGTATYGTQAQQTIGTTKVLWAGNVYDDGTLKYTGLNNDRDPILARIGGSVATNIVSGYLSEDVNMDGSVRYTGSRNDRDIILVNIGGTIATNTRAEQLP